MPTARDISDLTPTKLTWVDHSSEKSKPDMKPWASKPIVTPAQLKKFYAQLRRQFPGKIGEMKVVEAKAFNKMLKKLTINNKKK